MSTQRKQFPFSEFEPKWQRQWIEGGAFRAKNPGDDGFDATKPKFYILDMFPYPRDRKSTRLNSSHEWISRMPSSA